MVIRPNFAIYTTLVEQFELTFFKCKITLWVKSKDHFWMQRDSDCEDNIAYKENMKIHDLNEAYIL